jgi:hypothetical protein
MRFRVYDYHKGSTNTEVWIDTLEELKRYAEENGYKAVWPDFRNMILFVSEYTNFRQR